MLELKIKLQPKQKEFREALDKYSTVGFGGARGGGKSYALRNIFLIRRFEYPKSTGAIFRKSYPELFANHIQPMFQEHPGLRTYWSEAKKILTLPNGSTLQFCHCSNESDLSLHQGREWADLGFDEAGQTSEQIIRTLQGSNRSSIPGTPVRTALTMNPGGPNHGFLKRIFIDRRFNERERPNDYHFIQSLISDNKALTENDPDYVHRLNTETSEALRKAYLYGDWEILAGQFYSELRRDAHIIDPFHIPEHWNRFGALDFGYNHPAAVGWFATDEDGNTYLYRELVKAQMRADQIAEFMLQFPETKDMTFSAGHDCWAKRSSVVNQAQGNPPTIAEEFLAHGIHLKHAVIDRVAGAAHLRSYLALRGEKQKPRFYMFKTCPISYDTISRMVHDPNRVEDVLKVDAIEGDPTTGDDAYDMVRYGLMSRPAITDKLAPKHAVGSPGWYAQQATEIWEKEREKLMENQGNWPDLGEFPQM